MLNILEHILNAILVIITMVIALVAYLLCWLVAIMDNARERMGFCNKGFANFTKK